MDAKIATVSHPLFKLKPINRDQREHMKKALITEAEKLMSQTSEDKEECQPLDSYFNWSDDEDDDLTTNKQTKVNKTAIEVLKYLDDSNTSIECLQHYPCVENVFLKYNTTIPSSAPVERLFSFGSIILNGRRGRLSDQNFEKLTLIKANSC